MRGRAGSGVADVDDMVWICKRADVRLEGLSGAYVVVPTVTLAERTSQSAEQRKMVKRRYTVFWKASR
jgi:hypothetical protein